MRSRPRATRAALAGLVVIALAAVVLGVLSTRVPLSSNALRRAVVDALSERLDAEVEIGEFSLSLFPRVTAAGRNLVVRHQGRQDVPPLISISAFSAQADLTGLWRRHVGHVRLDGLEIRIPPDRAGLDLTPDAPADADGPSGSDVVIDELVATDARVVFLPREAHKTPKVWAVHTLRMESVSAGSPMPFTAELTNAVPPGRIDVAGTFGPWHRPAPAGTPLSGSFTFARADLGVFKGISGTLASTGAFRGRLDRLEVQGETTTPDFMLSLAGNPVPLETRYDAIVDGTDGTTRLEVVDATLGGTRIVATGGVFPVEGVQGRQVVLDVTIDKGRLDDVLRLAVGTPQPPMSGVLSLETAFVLPPGDQDVVEKLQLKGGFRIDGGRFADPTVERQIAELSDRARGRRADTAAPPPRVASDFSGRFVLDRGVLHLPEVAFDVPGAIVELAGTFDLPAETLDFAGSLYMDARLSEAVGGFKGFMLKVLDPLFRKDGRTVVPLKVTGPRQKPAFGLDMGRVFQR